MFRFEVTATIIVKFFFSLLDRMGIFYAHFPNKFSRNVHVLIMIFISITELYFLITKFLANGPFKHVGEVKAPIEFL